jgi:hypothetical protein
MLSKSLAAQCAVILSTAFAISSLLGCENATDPDAVSLDTLPGLDTSSWVYASSAPQSGDAIQYRLLVGGWDNGDTAETHTTDIFTNGSGEVICAFSYVFNGEATANDSGCDTAWSGYFELPVGFDDSYCVQLLGYDPLGKALNFYSGLGFSEAGLVCLEESEPDDGWFSLDGFRYENVGSNGFLLTAEDAYNFEDNEED